MQRHRVVLQLGVELAVDVVMLLRGEDRVQQAANLFDPLLGVDLARVEHQALLVVVDGKRDVVAIEHATA